MDKVAIFAEALLKTTVEERCRFLEAACGNDASLRSELDALLAAHDDAGSFLQKTPEELAAPQTGTAALSPDAWKSYLQTPTTSHCIGTLDQYAVLELTGRGGMGVVLQARDTKLNRTVALKMLAPELAKDPVAVQRFLREAQAAAAVSHDHVVTIHAVHEDLHPPIIAMEYIGGKSLQQKIDNNGALDVKSILRIGMQTAAGLAAAHRQGLVHRDVKPANILLENGIERVKLTDFGLARAIDDIGMTKTGTITGTPQYMSPEQAQGEPVDHRTDLFSLGCVLYAMCTGRAAFRADSAVAVMHCVVHQAPRPIREINEDIPSWLCGIVDRLLAKQPGARFESASKLEELLSQHLAHMQQPDGVAKPAEIVGAIQPSPEPARPNVKSAGSQMPSWFSMRIRPWMVYVAGLIGYLSIIQPEGPHFLWVLAVLGYVGAGVAVLCWFLAMRDRTATKNGVLYSGYTNIVAIALTYSFFIPVLALNELSAILLGLISALAAASALHHVRSRSYQRLKRDDISGADGFTVIDHINAKNFNPGVLGSIVGLIMTAWVVYPEVNTRTTSAERTSHVSRANRLEMKNVPPFIERKSGYYTGGREPRDPVVDLEITPDGQYVAVASRGKVSSGFLRIKAHSRTHTASAPGVVAITASPDSNRFAWVGDDGKPHVVSASTGRRSLDKDFESADDGVLTCVAYSSDRSRIFAGGKVGIHVWDAFNGGASSADSSSWSVIADCNVPV